MVTVAEKNRISALRERLTPFFYGRIFPIVVCLIALMAYQIEIWQLGLSVYVLFFCAILLLFKDMTPSLVLICTFAFNFRDLSVFSSLDLYLILFPAAACLIAHFIIYPVKFRFGEMFLPLTLVSAALALGGFGSFYLSQYIQGVSTVIGCGVMLLVIYVIFRNYISPEKDFDIKLYLCDVLIITAIACGMELCLKYLTIYLDNGQFNNGKVYQFGSMGWGHTNCVASLILLATPLCFYRISRAEKLFPWLIILAFLYVASYVSKSDGGFYLMVMLLPIYFLFTFIRMKKYKRTALALYLILLLALAALLLSLFADFNALSVKISELLKNDSGRTPLYRCAIDCFIRYPIFGVGLGFYNDALLSPTSFAFSTITTFNFHSVLFEVIATMGIFGLIAYVYYYVKRVSILARGNSSVNFFLTLAFLSIELYAFIDTCEFVAVPTMIILTLLVVFTECGNERNTDNLPLTLKFKLNFKNF